MTVVLDGETLGTEAAPGGLPALRERIRAGRRIPARLSVDGVPVPLERLARLDGREGRVELETLSLAAAAEGAYDAALTQLGLLEQEAENASDLLMLGRVQEGMASVAGVCRGIAAFLALVKPLDSLVGRPSAAGWEHESEGMRPLLAATEQSIGQQDWVLVGDQLRYEWSPRLRAWKALLPQARAEAGRLAAERGVAP